MLGLDAPTSALLLRLLLLGLTRTSLKSSLRSASTRGISLGCRGAGAGAVLAAEAVAVAALLCWLHRPACRAEPSGAAPRRPKPVGCAQSVFIGRGHRAPSLY